MSETPLVEMRHIDKSFGGIHAVEDMSVSVMPGAPARAGSCDVLKRQTLGGFGT